jgi:SAM-dependent methyltransferase
MTARENLYVWARAAFERLPEPVRQDAMRRRMERRRRQGLGQLKENQAMLALRLAELERRVAAARTVPAEVPDARFPAGVRSRLCTQAQLDEPWYAKWCDAMAIPNWANRKVWEFTYIAHVLDALGMLEPGRRGLGFGVGREPMVAAFAARGTTVVATDLAPEAQEALGWAHSDQHANSVESMQRPEVCDPEQFRSLVSWRPVDMRDIPTDLRGFDFCWSACSLEHLGTLAAGWDFVENSLATLAPGGIAVHTTEYNVGSNDDTIEAGGTVVYRERDVLELVQRLEAAGHEVAAVDLNPGDGVLDKYVDLPPYADEPVLRFLLGQYTLTSVAIVVRTAQ